MKILIVGSGGREHAIGWKLSQDPRAEKIYFAPGNGGTAEIGENIDLQVTELDKLRDFALEKKIDLTVVGPELPLTLGIADLFRQSGLLVFGPDREAAMLEGSKEYAKRFMQKYNVPTAGYQAFDDIDKALAAAEKAAYPLVIKADGIAAGKGVFICPDVENARQVLLDILRDGQFGSAGARVVMEDFLTGTEASILCFVDGKTIVPMVSAQDYKRALDGDKGLNTGGMGAISPAFAYTDRVRAIFGETVMKNTLKGIQAENMDYRGVLYFGLMINGEDIKILEFNARFGDPETQAVLMRLETSLLDIAVATAEGKLGEININWNDRTALCVVLASGGYPGKYETGRPVSIERDGLSQDVEIFHAGTALSEGGLVTSGGRVLVVSGLDEDAESVRDKVYKHCGSIKFEGMHYRKDIGKLE